MSDTVYAIVSGHASLHLKEKEEVRIRTERNIFVEKVMLQKDPIRVQLGVNNFIGGWGLLGDEKVVEPARVVGRGSGKYVTLHKKEVLNVGCRSLMHIINCFPN